MANITLEMVKELRELTGVGMTKCKEALVESDGDMQKAIDFLRKAGMTSGAKKEGRETKEGMISYAETATDIALVEINSETDFVAQNEKFKKFSQDIADQLVITRPQTLEAFLATKFEKDPSVTVDQRRNLLIQAIGENIQISRIEIIPKSPDASYGIYSHMGGKILSMVKVGGANNEQDLARDIAMHVAADDPSYLSPSEVPEEEKLREIEIAQSQVKNKPANIVEKIVEGKLKAHFDEICLLGQKYVKDPSMTVEEFVNAYGKKASKSIKVLRFWRWKVGQ